MKGATLLRLYHAQNGFCPYCLERMEPHQAKKLPSGRWDAGFTRDHVMPLALGGRKGGDNVVLAHIKCNGRKGNRPPTPHEIEHAREIHRSLQ